MNIENQNVNYETDRVPKIGRVAVRCTCTLYSSYLAMTMLIFWSLWRLIVN